MSKHSKDTAWWIRTMGGIICGAIIGVGIAIGRLDLDCHCECECEEETRGVLEGDGRSEDER